MVESEVEPVAVLPVRLDVMAGPGLVVMRKGQVSPLLMPAAPAATFVVNTNSDVSDTTPDGTCNSCSLREAVQESNELAGADMITGGTLAPGASCTLTVDVTGTTVGAKSNG